MTRDEIVDLVRRITDCDDTESEIDELMEVLKKTFRTPAFSISFSGPMRK